MRLHVTDAGRFLRGLGECGVAVGLGALFVLQPEILGEDAGATMAATAAGDAFANGLFALHAADLLFGPIGIVTMGIGCGVDISGSVST